jgi:hypothetical protein
MIFRNLIFICFLVGLFLTNVHSQETKINIDSASLKRQALEMSTSLIRADYKTFIKFTYPKVVEMMGGEEKMINYLKKEIEQMKNDGYAFKSIDVGLTAQKVRAGKEIHTLVSQRIIMAVPGGTLTANSYLLAISQNGGQSWHFVDTAPFNDVKKLKAVLPHYSSELKIPEKQLPIFTETK